MEEALKLVGITGGAIMALVLVIKMLKLLGFPRTNGNNSFIAGLSPAMLQQAFKDFSTVATESERMRMLMQQLVEQGQKLDSIDRNIEIAMERQQLIIKDLDEIKKQ